MSRAQRAHVRSPHVRFLLAIAAAASISACAVTQTYPGPERPRSEVAVLRETADASVLAIDGTPMSGNSWSLLPGPHTVWLRVRIFSQAPNTRWTIHTYCRVVLRAVAGEAYTSRVHIRKKVAPGLSEKLSIEVGIADSQDVLRAATSTCRGKRPDLGQSEPVDAL